MVKEYLEQINGRLTDDVNMFTGGINAYMDKAFIGPEEMPYCMNMTMYQPPMMCTRASRKTIENLLPETDKEIATMWAYNDKLVVWITRKPWTEGTATLYVYDIPMDETRMIDDTIPWRQDYWFCYCRRATDEFLYISTQYEKYRLNLNMLHPTSSDFSSIEDGHYGRPAFHKGRLFFANPSTNRITYSALYDFDNFTTYPDMSEPETLYADVVLTDGTTPAPPDVPADSGAYNTGSYQIALNLTQILGNNKTFYYDEDEMAFTFETGVKLVYAEIAPNDYRWQQRLPDYSSYAGDFFVTNSKGAITNVVSFDDKLVIFAEHSMHLLYGSSPIVGGANQFQLVDMNNNLGCIATKSIAIGGGYLFWLGDDNEIYSYTGSSLDMVSRPNSSRYVQRNGGISNIPLMPSQWGIGYGDYPEVCATATSDKYYITMPIAYEPATEELTAIAFPMFVFDIYNKVWWAEDGAFSAICNQSFGDNKILMARNGDIFVTTNEYSGIDHIRDSEHVISDIPIEYEFHTRVYGADGTNSRKTLSKVWVQASAEASVYLTDSWTTTNYWTGPYLRNTLKKIGEIQKKGRDAETRSGVYYNDVYEDYDYEQQMLVVPKMYGERLNTFQVVVQGTGSSKFYLMKREWSAR